MLWNREKSIASAGNLTLADQSVSRRMPSSGVWRRVDVVDVQAAATCSRWFLAGEFF
jgi:hypothetical protein